MNFKDRTGEKSINKQGLKMEIIRYGGKLDIDVLFEDGTILYNKSYSSFKNKTIINNVYIANIRIGETIKNCQGLNMKIINYNNSTNIDVVFDDGTIIKNRQYVSFKKGSILNPNFDNSRKINRVGEVKIMNNGESCKIINYKTAKDIDVEFINTGEIVYNTKYQCFKNGEIKSHLSPTIHGVGIVGNNIVTNECIKNISYSKWTNMLIRCYDEKFKEKTPSYKDVTCCKEWLYYENFKKWHDENYYEIENEKMCLDKDILSHNLKLDNKIYSPKTCLYVPERINILFVKSYLQKGNLPIGVVKSKNGKYEAQISKNGFRQRKCNFATPEEAFYKGYKQLKEQYIKQVADEYKDKIPTKLYDAMYKYEVEITD